MSGEWWIARRVAAEAWDPSAWVFFVLFATLRDRRAIAGDSCNACACGASPCIRCVPCTASKDCRRRPWPNPSAPNPSSSSSSSSDAAEETAETAETAEEGNTVAAGIVGGGGENTDGEYADGVATATTVFSDDCCRVVLPLPDRIDVASAGVKAVPAGVLSAALNAGVPTGDEEEGGGGVSNITPTSTSMCMSHRTMFQNKRGASLFSSFGPGAGRSATRIALPTRKFSNSFSIVGNDRCS